MVVSGMVFATTALESTPARAETNAADVPIFSNNTFYAYAQAGETLNLSFAKYGTPASSTPTAQRFDAIRPDGTVAWTCTIAATAANGQTCANPNLAVNQTGAWKIVSTRLDTSGSTQFNWNITVNSAGTPQTGRVWTNSYSVLQTDGVLRDLTYYMVNDSGYRYTTTLRGYNGIGSTIAANSLGLATAADCVPIYQSRDTNNVAGVRASGCGTNFRIFFQPPSSILPASTPSADGTLSVLPAPLADADLAVNDLAFAPSSANAAAGTFSYSITPRFQGAYQIQIDTNGNGTYTDPADRTITLGADGSGTYTYAFDGRDGQGNLIADCTLLHARIHYDSVGEMHVLQNDVEGRTGGIQITRTNGPAAPNSTIYWDDTAINPALHTNSTPVPDGTAGVNSTGGVHGWANGGDSWGNSAYIDDWTFRPADLGTGEIAIGGQCLNITKTADTDEVIPGDTITYTVTVQNTGDVDYTAATPASFTDDLSAVLDDATYNNDATGGATYAAPTLSWSAPLAAGATATITYSVTVNDPDTGDQRLTNAVVSTSPGVNCPPGGNDPACIVQIPSGSYTVAKTASTNQANPGDTITYTVTVANTGNVDYTATDPASFSDNLAAVLDDATYNNDATGGATFAAPTLSWSGPLAAGATATITYSVTVNNPDIGDNTITNTVRPTSPGGACDTPAECTTSALVQSFTVSKTSNPTGTVVPGSTITYTVTVANTGTAAYTAADPATFSDNLAAVLDDATYNNDATGGATYAAPNLSWSGPLAVGETHEITYTVTVAAAGTGDGTMTNAVTPTSPGGRCDRPDGCTTTNQLQAYTVAKTASTTQVNPGDTVTYTVTVANTGAVAYTAAAPASFTDDLTAVLDDATYNNDASNGATVSGITLSWAGPLAVGATTTITYSVTVKNPDNGDHSLNNAVTPTGTGGGCDPGACATITPVQSYTATKTADTNEVVAGDTITYTITLTNTGKADYTAADPATFTDDMSGVLDDATYNNDASNGATYAAPTLSWSGPLAVGATQTITYSVTVNTPDTGDAVLRNAVVTTTPGGNCDVGSNDPACLVQIPSGSFTVSKTASTTTADQGDKVTYTVTVTNTGAKDYTTTEPASFTDDLSAVLDDATYNGDASNHAVVTGTDLTWSGPLAQGATATITYSVTVNIPDTGDKVLKNFVRPTSPGGECTTADACATSTPIRALEVSKTVDTNSAAPGKTLKYTITIANTGTAAYTASAPASFTDDLSAVLDDATYNNDATNGAVYAAPVLSWSAPLAVGATETVTYSVTVNKPDLGDHVLKNSVVAPTSTCVAGSADPACSVTTKVTDPNPPSPIQLAFTGIGAWLTPTALGGLVAVLAGLALALFRRRKAAE